MDALGIAFGRAPVHRAAARRGLRGELSRIGMWEYLLLSRASVCSIAFSTYKADCARASCLTVWGRALLLHGAVEIKVQAPHAIDATMRRPTASG